MKRSQGEKWLASIRTGLRRWRQIGLGMTGAVLKGQKVTVPVTHRQLEWYIRIAATLTVVSSIILGAPFRGNPERGFAAGDTYTLLVTANCDAVPNSNCTGLHYHTYTISAAPGSAFDPIGGGKFSGTGSERDQWTQCVVESVTGTQSSTGVLTVQSKYLPAGCMEGYSGSFTATRQADGSFSGSGSGGDGSAENHFTVTATISPETSYVNSVLADHPSVYYRLGEARGSKTATDSSGHGRNATYGSATQLGIPGATQGDANTSAYSPAGNTLAQYQSGAGLPTGNTSISIEEWVNTTTGRGTGLTYGTRAKDEAIGLGANTGQIQISGFNDDIPVPTPYPTNDGKWHQLVLTYDGTHAQVYLDAIALKTPQFAGRLNISLDSTIGLILGECLNQTCGDAGALDEVAIYDHVLSWAQVEAHYQAAGTSLGGSSCGVARNVVSRSPYASTILGDHPCVYYRLGEAPGSISAIDSSGNGHNGVYQNSPQLGAQGALVGDPDTAMQIEKPGSDVYYSGSGGLPAGNSARTFEAWINTTNSSDAYGAVILSYGDQSCVSTGTFINFYIHSNNYIETNVGIGGSGTKTPYSITDGQWHHLVYTYDGNSNWSIYLDGQFLQSGTYPAPLSTATSSGLYVGNEVPPCSPTPFLGTLDEVAIYDHVLTASQVRVHYQSGVHSLRTVLGLGDSVTAGYGLGRADGTGNDNPQAYPALLAQSLGMAYRNYATAGACVSADDGVGGGTAYLSTCGRKQSDGTTYAFTPLRQQIDEASTDGAPPPSLITLTIGANDVIFNACLQAAMQGDANKPTVDPCGATNLNQNLSAFTTALKADLGLLNKTFPGVPILLNEYYNPLPPGPKTNQGPCTFEDFLPTWVYAAQRSGWQATAEAFFLHHDQFVSAEGQIQQALYQRAQYILGRLATAEHSAAASAQGVTMASHNFSGHDMCQPGTTPWVFGPDAHVALKIDEGPWFSHTFHLDVGPVPYHAPNTNPNLEVVCAKNVPFGPFVKGNYNGNPCVQTPFSGRQVGELSYTFSTNGLPHPTAVGQGAIARDLVQDLLKQSGEGCDSLVQGVTPSSAAGATFRVRAIEVTQVVQDWCDSVPLVANKPTAARVFMESESGGDVTATATLVGTRDGQSLGSVLPDNQGGAVTVGSDATQTQIRADITRSLNFTLPTSWLHGTIRLQVQGSNGQPLGCEDPTSLPSACVTEVTFHPVPTLNLVLVPIGYMGQTSAGSSTRRLFVPSSQDLQDVVQRIRETYPISHLQAVATPPKQAIGLQDPSGDSGPYVNALLPYLSRLQQQDPGNRIYLGVVKGGPSVRHGFAGEAYQGGRVADVVYWGPYDSPYNDAWQPPRYEMSHELGHALGLLHPVTSGLSGMAGYCGDSPDNGRGNYHAPVVSVDPRDWRPYPYVWGPGGEDVAARWFTSDPTKEFPHLKAYALGVMDRGPNREVWGFNSGVYGHDNLHTVVNPHHTFSIMSYCIGTDDIPHGSKYQWISAQDYEQLLHTLGGS